jgi:hypothetical protein
VSSSVVFLVNNDPNQPQPVGSVDTSTPGTYIITYTATDSGNHTGTVQRAVIVESGGGTAPPTITLNGSPQMTAECGAFIDPGAVAVVPCGGSVPVTASTFNTQTPGTYTITYTACVESAPGQCDPARTSQVERTVTIEDTTPPTITVNGANPMTVECGSTFTDRGATARDGCAGDSAASASGSVNTNSVGQYTITYNATDPSGHPAVAVTRIVNVVDTTPPAVTAPPDVTISTGAGATSCNAIVSNAALGTASANDACQGPLSTTRSGVPSGNVFPVGQTIITYSATDVSNNTGTATQRVTVVDTTPPVITLNGSNPITAECHTSFIDPGATTNDACNGAVSVTQTNNVNINVPGSYTVTYSARDAGNNTSTATRTVNVTDTTAPAITLSNLTIFLNDWTVVFNSNTVIVNGTTYPFNGVSFTRDNRTFTFNGSTITITINGQTTSYPLNGQTLVLWTPNHQYQTVKVADLLAAVADSCDAGTNLNNVVISQVTSDELEDIAGNGDGNTLNDIVIAANCKSVQLRAERDSNGNGRVYTITFRVRDASGNSTTITSKLNIFNNNFNVVDSGPHYSVNGTCP